jgi:hypothetical protein
MSWPQIKESSLLILRREVLLEMGPDYPKDLFLQ